MQLIKEFALFLFIAAFMLSLVIIGVCGFALVHIAYLKPDAGWHERRAERARKDSLEALKDSSIIELRAHILDRDTTKVIGWDSAGAQHVKRSSYWND